VKVTVEQYKGMLDLGEDICRALAAFLVDADRQNRVSVTVGVIGEDPVPVLGVELQDGFRPVFVPALLIPGLEPLRPDESEPEVPVGQYL
jgi:hypothetical protein